MKSITQVVQNLLKPYIDNNDNAVAGNIAPVETDATSASQSYAVGKQLILAGVLYDVTAAITAGDALVVGTNIAVADDVVTQLASVNGALTNEIDKAYKTDDAAITEVASDDLLPIYDTSATAKKKIAVNNFIGGLVSNPNLLDNPWFTVNQRGQNSYTYADANIYTVDRWQLLYSGSATRNADKSISLANASGVQLQFRQLFDSDVVALLAGKTVTLSAIVENYSGSNISMRIRETKAGAFSKNISKSIDKTGLISITGVIGSDTDGIDFDILISNTAQSSITVKALKLELGSVSTLAMDTAPNYATELLKCQRYFVRFTNDSLIIFSGVVQNTNARATVLLPTAMRALPTITTSGTLEWIAESANSHMAATLSLASHDNQLITIKEDNAYPSISSASIVILRIWGNSSLAFSADL